MKRLAWLGMCLMVAVPAFAQHEAGLWRAESKSARDVTGDIGFGGQKVVIAFQQFTVAPLHELSADEILALFNPDDGAGPGGPGGHGTLFRLDIPATKKFGHKTALCGSEDTEFMATYVDGKKLRVAFFSGNKMPTLSIDALQNDSNLCGMYGYQR